MILWEAQNKKVGDSSQITFICYVESSHEQYVFMPTWTNGEMILLMYSPHFFSRFTKCMKISINGIELIKRYFKQNNN